MGVAVEVLEVALLEERQALEDQVRGATGESLVEWVKDESIKVKQEFPENQGRVLMFGGGKGLGGGVVLESLALGGLVQPGVQVIGGLEEEGFGFLVEAAPQVGAVRDGLKV